MTRLVMLASFSIACSSDLRTEPIDGGDGDGDVHVTVNNYIPPNGTTTDTTSTTTTTTTDTTNSGDGFIDVCVEWDRDEELFLYVWNWTEWSGTWPNLSDPETCEDPGNGTVCCTLELDFGDLFQVNAHYFDESGKQHWIATFDDPYPDNDGVLDDGAWLAGKLTIAGDVYPIDPDVNGLPEFDSGNPDLDDGDAQLMKQCWDDGNGEVCGVGLYGRR